MNSKKIFSKKIILNNTIYGLFSILLLFFYMYLFMEGNISAPDRENYYLFFTNPYLSRFEPIFELIGKLFYFLEFPPISSLNILGIIIFMLAVLNFKFYFNTALLYAISIFVFIFFAIYGIFEFAQLRAGLAIWSGLLIFYFYDRKKTKTTLFLLLLTIFIHKLMVFFVLSVFLVYVFNISIKYILLFIFSIIAMLLGFLKFILSFFSFIFNAPYYERYFYELTVPLYKSPFLISYFLIIIFLYFFRKDNKVMKYKIIWIALPMAIVAMLTGIDLFVKFASPLILLTWIVFFQIIIKYSTKFKYITFTFMLLLSIPSMYYAFVRY